MIEEQNKVLTTQNKRLEKTKERLEEENIEKDIIITKQNLGIYNNITEEEHNDIQEELENIQKYLKNKKENNLQFSQYDLSVSSYLPVYPQQQSYQLNPVVDIWGSALSSDGQNTFDKTDINILMSYFSQKRIFPINAFDMYILKFYQHNSIIQNIIESYTIPLINNLYISIFNDKYNNYNNCLLLLKKTFQKAINLAELLGGCYVVYNNENNDFFVLTRQEFCIANKKTEKQLNSKSVLSTRTNFILTLSQDKKEEYLKDYYVYLKDNSNVFNTGIKASNVFFVKGSNQFYFSPMANTMNGFNASILEKCFDGCLALVNNVKLANKLSTMNGMPNITYQKQSVAKTNTNSIMDNFSFSRSEVELQQTKNKLFSGSNVNNLFSLNKDTQLEFIDNATFRNNLESQMYSVILSIYGIPELYNNDAPSVKLFNTKKDTKHLSKLIENIIESKYLCYLSILNKILIHFLMKNSLITEDIQNYNFLIKNNINSCKEDNKQILSYNAVANQEDLSKQIIQQNIA